jgi:hypothetical protein
MIWLLPPPLQPSLPTVSSTGDLQEDCIETTWFTMGEGEGGKGGEGEGSKLYEGNQAWVLYDSVQYIKYSQGATLQTSSVGLMVF